MKIDGMHYRSVTASGQDSITIIDQRWLPFELRFVQLHTLSDVAIAIKDMWTRGAPLIGAVGAYGLCFALRDDTSTTNLEQAYTALLATRPTAINLKWALDAVKNSALPLHGGARISAAFQCAARICDEDVAINEAIGQHGLQLFRQHLDAKPTGSTLNILTHCNAGWLATVDWGTALAPIYMAHDAGLPVHVYVDETRPRNQGASLTAWELQQHGVPFTLIADNTGGHLMQHGLVDLCIVGTDRVTAQGDVCNKIGTYLKALAAKDNNIPFYVALPSPTIDWTVMDGLREIPIEQRSAREITHILGTHTDGTTMEVCITLPQVNTVNYAFDVTPARLVTALITERGIVSPDALREL